jgi:glyoxylase-like metal-dependent hydrolase (beta-lactamase superfamily II)
VRHPAGDVLIDAGFGAHADEHISSLPSYRRSPHALGATVSQQLDAVGYDRTNLLGVVITHSHWDHVSGLDSLDVPIITTAEEVDYAAHNKADTVFTRVVRDRQVTIHTFTGPSYLGFSTSWDFYGDGSMVIVPAAGHTPGSVIVFVALPDGRRYAFIGDLTWQLEGIIERRQRPWLMRRLADSDPASIQRDIDRIAAIASAVHVVPSHDRSSYAGIPELSPVTTATPGAQRVRAQTTPEQPTGPDAADSSGDADRADR